MKLWYFCCDIVRIIVSEEFEIKKIILFIFQDVTFHIFNKRTKEPIHESALLLIGNYEI